MSGKWILMAVHSIIYTAFTAFAVYILIHFTAVSLFNKNGEYTGLHNGQIAQKLQREYRRLWFMVFHYHPQLVKDGVGIRRINHQRINDRINHQRPFSEQGFHRTKSTRPNEPIAS